MRLKINDKIRAMYYGIKIEGIIDGFDTFGIYAKFETPIKINGISRDGVCLDKKARKTIELIESGERVKCECSYGFCTRA